MNFTEDGSYNIQQTSTDGSTVGLYKLGDMAWVYAATTFILPLIPAIGFLYSGLGSKHSTPLAMVFQCFASLCLTSVQWFFWGYSLAYSGDSGGHGIIGDLKKFGMMNIESSIMTSYYVPEVLYCFFQLTFAAATVAIALGGAIGRARMLPLLIWQFWWVTLVYCPLAHWTWSTDGWLYKLGALDYAGGTPVHVASGTAALAYAIFLSEPWKSQTKRLPPLPSGRPHNEIHVLVATVVIWSAWIPFDGAGGNLALNVRSVMAGSVTNLSGAAGAMSWLLFDYAKTRKFSIVSACSGAISGLVGITPASGFVGHPAALLIGTLNGVVCNAATLLKTKLHFDDPCDVVAVHMIGGAVGNFMTGLFAQKQIAGMDGITDIPGGAFLDGHWRQIGLQLADTTSAICWSFFISFGLLILIDLLPCCHVRADVKERSTGLSLEEAFPFEDEL